MTEQHPITPPPELVQQWREQAPRFRDGGVAREGWLINKAAQWGADQEHDLSPQAQAVLDAFGKHPLSYDALAADLLHSALPAALEAAVDQVISLVPPPCEDFDEYAHGFLAAHVKYRAKLLTIAAELRSQDQRNTEDNQCLT